MKKELICQMSVALPGTVAAPDNIMYLPAGRSVPQAKLDGQPAQPVVIVDRTTAEQLDADLQARLTAPGAKPFIDFDHEAKGRAAHPVKFHYVESGPKPGVYLQVQWTRSGAMGVTADAGGVPDYTHFSPRCNYDAKTQRVVGLMPAETGNSIGGLVNDPAFQTISPLLGSKAAAQAAPNQTETHMNPKLLAALAAHGLLNEAEAVNQDTAGDLVASRLTARLAAPSGLAELTAAHTAKTSELAAVRAELTAAREKLADAFVNELVASKKVAPLDEPTKQQLRAQWLKDSTGTELMARLIPAQAGAPTEALTDGNEHTPATPAMSLEASKAHFNKVQAKQRELLASRPGLDPHSAWTMAEQSIPRPA